MDKATDHFSILELSDIRIAIKDSIKTCDTMIEDCTHLKLDSEIIQVWIEKRERLTNSLDKLTTKPL